MFRPNITILAPVTPRAAQTADQESLTYSVPGSPFGTCQVIFIFQSTTSNSCHNMFFDIPLLISILRIPSQSFFRVSCRCQTCYPSFLFSWNLIFPLLQTFVADNVRSTDLEYFVQTAVYEYLYISGGGCSRSLSLNSVQQNPLAARIEIPHYDVDGSSFEFQIFFDCRDVAYVLLICVFASTSDRPCLSVILFHLFQNFSRKCYISEYFFSPCMYWGALLLY